MNLNCRAVIFFSSFVLFLFDYFYHFFSLFRFLASVFVKWFFYHMDTCGCDYCYDCPTKIGQWSLVFGCVFWYFKTYIHIFHNQFRPPQNQFLSFYLACQSDITDHDSNVVSHLLLALFACHCNYSVGDKPNKKFSKRSLWIYSNDNKLVFIPTFFMSPTKVCYLDSRDLFLSFLVFYSPINWIVFVFIWILLFLLFQEEKNNEIWKRIRTIGVHIAWMDYIEMVQNKMISSFNNAFFVILFLSE